MAEAGQELRSICTQSGFHGDQTPSLGSPDPPSCTSHNRKLPLPLGLGLTIKISIPHSQTVLKQNFKSTGGYVGFKFRVCVSCQPSPAGQQSEMTSKVIRLLQPVWRGVKTQASYQNSSQHLFLVTKKNAH